MSYKGSKILVIDDDHEVRSLISGVLSDEGYVVNEAKNETEALSQVRKNAPDLVFLDLWIDQDESGGLKILEKIKQINYDIPIVIISGHGTIDVAMNAVRLGAFDFMEKPFVVDRLLLTCERALENSKLKNEVTFLKNEKTYSDVFAVGDSSFATSIMQTIEKLAASNSRIFINCSAGLCADSIAYKIHRISPRQDQNFISVNCISDDPEKFEAELFGTEKSYGYIEKAAGGTLFLEEVHYLPKSTQRKLLMLLQSGKFPRGSRTVCSDMRLICSAKVLQLGDFIRDGKFSEELLYRIKISEINVPDIKLRREDIIPIVRYYLEGSETFFGMKSREFTTEAISILQAYDWPGNIYQIKNVVESSLINARNEDSEFITEQCLPSDLISDTREKFEHLNVAKLISLPLREAKDCFESDYLRAQVQKFSGNISQTATFIGMERSALHRKLKTLNVPVCRTRGSSAKKERV